MRTTEAMERVFTTHWELVGTLDPWTNGQLDAELDGVLDPDERGRIIDRHQVRHDWCVGQRMANQNLEYNLRAIT